MIQEYGVKPGVGGTICIEENHRISLHKRSDVENIDLEKRLVVARIMLQKPLAHQNGLLANQNRRNQIWNPRIYLA
jgi:hypothetical protein